MKKSFSRKLWVAGPVVLAAGVLWYLRGGAASTAALAPSGAVQIELRVGDASVSALTAVISGKRSFEAQTHKIKVTQNQPVTTALLGGFPAGSGYTVEVKGGPCHGSSAFEVQPDKVAKVQLTLDCGGPQITTDEANDEPRCGDGIINQPAEQCDGKSLPENAPPGTTCSRRCTLLHLESESECKECAKSSCVAQRAAVDASISTAGPILECVLGSQWAEGGRAPAKSCSNVDLLTCYCGSMRAQDCANAPPSSLSGPCVPEILVGTECQDSICVAGNFLRATNSNGKAMRYIQCMQDFCYEDCFGAH